MNRRTVLVVVFAGVATLGLGAYFGRVRPIQLGMKQVGNLVHMRGYVAALDDFREAHGRYPQTLKEASADTKLPQGERFVGGLDLWGHPVLYRSDGSTYLLVSFGRDGQPDGSDYAAMRAVGRLDNSPCGNPDADIIFTESGELRTCGK